MGHELGGVSVALHVHAVFQAQGAVINLSSDSEDTLVVQQPNGLNFEIIRKDPTSTSIEILLPGFGIGTVERVASQEKRSRLSPRSETAGSISSLLNTTVPVRSATKHISISESANGASQCASLLPAFGRRLESIRVVAKDGDEELVKTILDNCPNLRTLELSGVKLPSFRPFIDVYTVHNRHLVELVLLKWTLDEEESLVEFLDMLADPAFIPSKRVEKLVLNDKSNVDNVLKEESALALARVTHLNGNSTISRRTSRLRSARLTRTPSKSSVARSMTKWKTTSARSSNPYPFVPSAHWSASLPSALLSNPTSVQQLGSYRLHRKVWCVTWWSRNQVKMTKVETTMMTMKEIIKR